VKCAWIESQRDRFPLERMCGLLGLSKSGYFAWRWRGSSPREHENTRLVVQMRAIAVAHDRNYGSPRMTRELRGMGFAVSENRVARLMRAHGIAAKHKRRYRATTDSDHKGPIAPNLLDRQFNAARPNAAWVSDITFIWTDAGFTYLAAIVDLCTRRCVGWKVSDRCDAKLVCEALQAAIARHRPAPGLMVHSDRGSQYASGDYRKLLADNHMLQSMSRRGNCWDNAPMESMFKTLKVEFIHERRFPTTEALQSALFRYLETYYNTRRRHSAIGYLSPAQFEVQHQEARAA
jgi:putative transposase